MPAHIENAALSSSLISYPLLNRLALRISVEVRQALRPRSDNAGRSEEYLRMCCPVFVDLRRKFDKIRGVLVPESVA